MKLTPLTALTAAGLTALATANAASADVLLTEDFAYPDGSLVGAAGSPWATHSGTPGDLLVSGGQAVVQHGAPSEDVNIGFVDQTTGVLTASFDVTVNAATVIDGSDNEYFAHFFTDGSFNFRSRLSVAEPAANGDYRLGISSTTSTEEAFLTDDFAFGDVVSVVLSLDIISGIGSVTVGAATAVGTSASPGETINRFALRQSDSSVNETILIDNLVIDGVVPEPASLALLGLGGLALTGRRRRQA